MRKIVFLIAIVVLIFVGVFLSKNSEKNTSQKPTHTTPQELISQKKSSRETYILVPYWALNEDISLTPYDTLLYFGVSADKSGIMKNEEGYRNIEKFSQVSSSKKTLLVVRMLSTSDNQEILKNVSSQKKIIQEAVSVARAYGFSGIVLDLEMQGLPFESLVNSITDLNAQGAGIAGASDLSFGTLIYGDTFYRIRPYDVESIGKHVDRIYVMAYDFSKAKSDPGPNFPLEGKDKYGYDFKTMTADFLKVVPRNKITILFGMFGYDWSVDEKKRGTRIAESKTSIQFERFQTGCVNDSTCESSVDPFSHENKITYSKDGEDHVIWFENHRSMEEKEKYLQSQNLYSVGYWAYSYF